MKFNTREFLEELLIMIEDNEKTFSDDSSEEYNYLVAYILEMIEHAKDCKVMD